MSEPANIWYDASAGTSLFTGLPHFSGRITIYPTHPIQDQLLPVIENRPLSASHFLLTVEAGTLAASSRPGQFVMIRFPGCRDPLLPRPMSICDLLPTRIGLPDRVQILHKVVGKGTALLARLTAGDRIQILGPLGTPFRVPAPPPAGGRAWLVAGGIGVAIFPFLARALRRAGWPTGLLFGARTAGDLVHREWFAAQGVEVLSATEDGSEGRPGLVTRLLEEVLSTPGPPPAVYACGPQPMLRAVSHLLSGAGVEGQLSLESYMGCGIGACLGCVVKVRRGNDFAYARICVEGPTLSSREILWE